METSGPPGIIKPFRLENIWIEIMRMTTNLTTRFLGFNLSEVVSLIYGPVDNYWNNLNTSSFQPFHIAAGTHAMTMTLRMTLMMRMIM